MRIDVPVLLLQMPGRPAPASQSARVNFTWQSQTPCEVDLAPVIPPPALTDCELGEAMRNAVPVLLNHRSVANRAHFTAFEIRPVRARCLDDERLGWIGDQEDRVIRTAVAREQIRY